jgi:protease I
VTNLLRKALEAGAVVSSIGAGAIPLLAAGLLRGRRCTGNAVVAFMMREACRFEDAPVVVDGKLMTARDTIDTPRLLHQLARHFDPEYQDIRAGILAGCRALFVTGDEFEDIELTVPVMELLHRGCEIAIATFAPRIRAASALGSGLAAIGSFGVTVPFQEIDRSSYRLLDTRDVRMEDFDLLIVPGGFNPWNMIEAVEPVDILRRAQAHGKVIGLICHSEIVGAAAGVLSGKVTCGWLACKSSVEIMGGDYSFERSAAIDGNIVSGRTPNDVPEFLDACTEALLCRRRGSTWSPPTQLG